MSGAVSWMLTPLSGGAAHGVPPWVAWHGRLMVLAWGVVLPAGILIARYLKVIRRGDWPRTLDSGWWWRAHIALQCAGVYLMTLAIVIAVGHAHSRSALASLHHRIGWALLSIGWLQVAGGVFRGTKGGPTSLRLRGDHYDLTTRRIVFETVHKTLGWLAIPLAIAGGAAGLVLADAPRWMRWHSARGGWRWRCCSSCCSVRAAASTPIRRSGDRVSNIRAIDAGRSAGVSVVRRKPTESGAGG